MADLVHGWWLDSLHTETNVDFEPLLDSEGNPILSLSQGAAYAQYGNIITSTWRFAQCVAVTVGHTPPSTSLVDMDPTIESFFVEDAGGIVNPDYLKLILEGPASSTIKLSPIGGSQWEQYNYVTTDLNDPIMNTWRHTVTFRCGKREKKQGMYNEADQPPIEPELEDE